MKLLFTFLLSILFCLSNFCGFAQQTSDWTIDDVINQESARNLEFSPDGSKIVWVRRRPDRKKDHFDNDLYLTLLNKKEKGHFKSIQLTRGDESDYSPLFSKDGATIYFLSSREKGKKLWAMSVYGGEAYEVDTFKTGISSIKWLNDHTLAFKSDEGKTLYEQQLEEAKDNTMVIEDTTHFKASRIYSYDLKTKHIKRLTDNTYPVSEFDISKDGTWMVTSHILSPDYGIDANPAPTYYLWNLETGKKRQILKEGYQTPGNFGFTQDNKGFYFVSVTSSDPHWSGAGISKLYYYDLASNSVQKVPIDWDWGLGSGYDMVGNDVIAGLANGPTVKLAYMEKSGSGWKKRTLDAGDYNDHISVIAVGKDQKNIAYVYTTASTPPQYRLAALQKGRNAVTIPKGEVLFELNDFLKNKPIAKTEVVHWKGAMDDDISGILYYPKGYQQGRAYPLIVSIHGGPSGVDTDSWGESWAYFPNIYSQKGAFVLMPNYHGSSNHGLDFVESIKGHYYEYELPDIMAGIDMLVDKGMVDRDSLGVKGWSNGAILTTMLTVQHPTVFKAAAPGAGDVNWTSDYGTCAFGVQFDQSYFNGAPWDDTDGQIFNSHYIQKSPLFEMEKVHTPTIIFHGSEDRSVPRDQGWEYYRALQQIGQAPVRFLWFPGQPHGLQKITHQTRKMKEEIRWFDTYLFGTYKAENETFKKGSPIAEILKKDKAKVTKGLYGVVENGTLIPETVSIKKDSISIGRFEVTNAQFAAYDNSYSYLPVQANYPVTGLSLDQVNSYLKWLSNKTGQTYRLPNAEEAKSLQEKAKSIAKEENTLNYWAGYDITLDEVPAFREKLRSVNHSLLKEAGSFKGTAVGEALLYDIGGNAAEYYTGGSVYGYSAVSFVDKRGEAPKPPENYIGFRVVKE